MAPTARFVAMRARTLSAAPIFIRSAASSFSLALALSSAKAASRFAAAVEARAQGLTLAHFRAQLEDLREHIVQVGALLEHLRATSTG